LNAAWAFLGLPQPAAYPPSTLIEPPGRATLPQRTRSGMVPAFHTRVPVEIRVADADRPHGGDLFLLLGGSENTAVPGPPEHRPAGRRGSSSATRRRSLRCCGPALPAAAVSAPFLPINVAEPPPPAALGRPSPTRRTQSPPPDLHVSLAPARYMAAHMPGPLGS